MSLSRTSSDERYLQPDVTRRTLPLCHICWRKPYTYFYTFIPALLRIRVLPDTFTIIQCLSFWIDSTTTRKLCPSRTPCFTIQFQYPHHVPNSSLLKRFQFYMDHNQRILLQPVPSASRCLCHDKSSKLLVVCQETIPASPSSWVSTMKIQLLPCFDFVQSSLYGTVPEPSSAFQCARSHFHYPTSFSCLSFNESSPDSLFCDFHQELHFLSNPQPSFLPESEVYGSKDNAEISSNALPHLASHHDHGQ